MQIVLGTVNLTTNGTLINDEVADFLVENDFILNVSIDGSEEEHNRSRKYPDGTGSFATIISNINNLRNKYPDYERKITISTTINPYADLSCVLEYFSTDEIFQDKSIMFNQMVEKDYNGPCMPGVKRLFVRTDGALFPCERVNETLDFFKIGTIEDGIDIDKVLGLLNIGKLTSDECKSCWALRQCSLCAGLISFDESPTREDKLRSCPECKSRSISDIYELCVLSEFGYKAEGGSFLLE